MVGSLCAKFRRDSGIGGSCGVMEEKEGLDARFPHLVLGKKKSYRGEGRSGQRVKRMKRKKRGNYTRKISKGPCKWRDPVQAGDPSPINNCKRKVPERL